MKYNILLVDGPYLAHRSECSPFQVSTRDGRSATMILGFMRSLNALRKQFNPKKIIVTWESHGTKSWRREMYPEYKPKKEVTDDFIEQLKDIQRLLKLFRVEQYSADNNEADDVIATISAQMNYPDDDPIVIFTVDKDIMQVVNQFVHIWNGKMLITKKEVGEKFDINPDQIPDFLAIVGDSADNIKGLSGYGPKKVADLLNDHFLYIEDMKNHELQEHKEKLLLNKKLTTLNKNCKLRPYEIDGQFSKTQILDKYELDSIKSKLSEYNLLGGKRKKFW